MSLAVRLEHAKARPLSLADLKAFVADGVPPAALSWTACGQVAMIMRDRVVFDRGRFEFARDRPEGEAANAFTVPLLDEAGDMLDIMAWRPGGPVGLWNGAVTMASEEQVLGPRLDVALDVHDTVLDWLRAERRGIVILNAPRAADRLAGSILRTTTADHARRLRTGLARPAPRVLVAEPARLAA